MWKIFRKKKKEIYPEKAFEKLDKALKELAIAVEEIKTYKGNN